MESNRWRDGKRAYRLEAKPAQKTINPIPWPSKGCGVKSSLVHRPKIDLSFLDVPFCRSDTVFRGIIKWLKHTRPLGCLPLTRVTRNPRAFHFSTHKSISSLHPPTPPSSSTPCAARHTQSIVGCRRQPRAATEHRHRTLLL